MNPFGKLTPIEEAWSLLESHTPRCKETETTAVESAVHRVLAKELLAPFDMPNTDRAAMDGYVFKFNGKVSGGPFNIAGKIYAGHLLDIELDDGICAEIATGGIVPPSADTVVQVELTRTQNGQIFLDDLSSITVGMNILKKGSDVRKDSLVLPAGTVLNAAHVASLAACGFRYAEVLRRPKVVLFSSGDEVRQPGEPLNPGEVYDSNRMALLAVLKEAGAEVLNTGALPDNPELLAKQLEHLEADLAVFIGGTSVGNRDFAGTVLKEKGTVHFHGLAIKPGKPILFADYKNTSILALPGYPTSCLVTAHLFLRRWLQHWWHQKPVSETRKVETGEAFRSPEHLHQFIPIFEQDGKAFSCFKGSGAVTSLTNANGLLQMPVGTDRLEAGQPGLVIPF